MWLQFTMKLNRAYNFPAVFGLSIISVFPTKIPNCVPVMVKYLSIQNVHYIFAIVNGWHVLCLYVFFHYRRNSSDLENVTSRSTKFTNFLLFLSFFLQFYVICSVAIAFEKEIRKIVTYIRNRETLHTYKRSRCESKQKIENHRQNIHNLYLSEIFSLLTHTY